MSLSIEQVEQIARLARLTLTKEDIPRYAQNLSEILAFVAQMSEVNTQGIAPMAHPMDSSQRLRRDEVTETNQRELFQSIAPAVAAGLYLVPQVIE